MDHCVVKKHGVYVLGEDPTLILENTIILLTNKKLGAGRNTEENRRRGKKILDKISSKGFILKRYQ